MQVTSGSRSFGTMRARPVIGAFSLRARAAELASARLLSLLLTGVTALVCYGALAQGAFFWDQASFFGSCAAVLALASAARARRDSAWAAAAFGLLSAGLAA